jgi:hypothetical protein
MNLRHKNDELYNLHFFYLELEIEEETWPPGESSERLENPVLSRDSSGSVHVCKVR